VTALAGALRFPCSRRSARTRLRSRGRVRGPVDLGIRALRRWSSELLVVPPR
jgi:hypothetical protein